MDLYILKLLLRRSKYMKLRSVLPEDALEANTAVLLKGYALFFKEHPSADVVDLDMLLYMLKQKIKDAAQLAVIKAIIKQLGESVPEEYIEYVERNILEQATATQIQAVLNSYAAGAEVDVVHSVQALLQKQLELQEQQACTWESESVSHYIEEELKTDGLNLNCIPAIGEQLKGLRGGDNIVVAMPTDKGKTWLLCRLAVHFAKQLAHNKDERPVLYCTNEHRADRILPRIHRTALRAPVSVLRERIARGEDIDAAYAESIGGADRIRCINIHNMTVSQVIAKAVEHNAAVLITDMTQRVRLGTSKGSEHQDIEEIWDALRKAANIYDFVHVGSAQISVEGFNMLFPPLSALKQSKAGIQNTVDLALYGGALQSTEPAVELLRGLSTPKNKLVKEGCRGYNAVEVYWDPETNDWS